MQRAAGDARCAITASASRRLVWPACRQTIPPDSLTHLRSICPDGGARPKSAIDYPPKSGSRKVLRLSARQPHHWTPVHNHNQLNLQNLTRFHQICARIGPLIADFVWFNQPCPYCGLRRRLRQASAALRHSSDRLLLIIFASTKAGSQLRPVTARECDCGRRFISHPSPTQKTRCYPPGPSTGDKCRPSILSVRFI